MRRCATVEIADSGCNMVHEWQQDGSFKSSVFSPASNTLKEEGKSRRTSIAISPKIQIYCQRLAID